MIAVTGHRVSVGVCSIVTSHLLLSLAVDTLVLLLISEKIVLTPGNVLLIRRTGPLRPHLVCLVFFSILRNPINKSKR